MPGLESLLSQHVKQLCLFRAAWCEPALEKPPPKHRLMKAANSCGQCLPLKGQMGNGLKSCYDLELQRLGHFFSSGILISPIRVQWNWKSLLCCQWIPTLILKPGRFWRRHFKVSNLTSPPACFTSGIQSLMLNHSMSKNQWSGMGCGKAQIGEE